MLNMTMATRRILIQTNLPKVSGFRLCKELKKDDKVGNVAAKPQQPKSGRRMMQQKSNGGDNNLQELLLNYIREKSDSGDQEGASMQGCVQRIKQQRNSSFSSQEIREAVLELFEETHMCTDTNGRHVIGI